MGGRRYCCLTEQSLVAPAIDDQKCLAQIDTLLAYKDVLYSRRPGAGSSFVDVVDVQPVHYLSEAGGFRAGSYKF